MTTITRRQLLIGMGTGTGVVVSVGAWEAIGGGRRHEIHSGLGLAGTPDSHVPSSAATIVSGQLASKHMGRSVGWSLSTPTQPAKAVIFCLHGYGNDHRFAFNEIHLPDVIELAQAPLAVAAVDGGRDSYWHQRADGTDPLAMLLDEFIPLIERRTNIFRRAVLGWSMGGYGSLLVAERAAEQFFAVTAASPALWTSSAATAPGAFDNAGDYHRFDVFAAEPRLAGLTVRVDCGTGDPFYKAARQFVSGLPPGHQGTFGAGSHEAGYWRSVAPAQIATIVQALPAFPAQPGRSAPAAGTP